MGSIWNGPTRSQNVRTFSKSERPGPDQLWRMQCRKRQDGVVGDWQQESPYKEELEVFRHSSELRFEGLQIRRAWEAEKSVDGKIT